MKILLIRPPSTNLYQGYLPLGLAYIAGVLLRNGHEVAVWDLDAERWSAREVLSRIEEQGGLYCLVGISALAGDYPYVKWIAGIFKRMHPETRLVLGGYLASALPAFLMERLPLDFLAVGEGEETAVELAAALEEGSDPGRVKGIYFRDDSGKIRAASPRERFGELERLPFPPW
ncbi:MAG: cobalamin-dependent protein, partial [Deltaproteobacteria bacterium]|nr:cobalamin-dependent protein [Deltaproteobacteria bacterium]